MLGSILPLLVFPYIVSSEASPVPDIHPGHGGAPAPAMPPPLEPPSYYSAALPTPSSISNHDDSNQEPLDRMLADLDVPQQPFKPSPSSVANLAIYYGMGTSSSPEGSPLVELCADDSIESIILGYVRGFKASNGFPIIDFGAACTTWHADDDRYAPGLALCPELGRQMQACQTRGKKVLLSIGGPHSNPLSFVDVADARRAAVMLWSFFGQGNPHGPDMRPLGEAAVDGFDFAWVSTPSLSSSISAFASTLRTLSDMRKNYKPSPISMRPSCVAEIKDANPSSSSAREMIGGDVIDFTFTTTYLGDDGLCSIGSLKESRFCTKAGLERETRGGCAGPYRRVLL